MDHTSRYDITALRVEAYMIKKQAKMWPDVHTMQREDDNVRQTVKVTTKMNHPLGWVESVVLEQYIIKDL